MLADKTSSQQILAMTETSPNSAISASSLQLAKEADYLDFSMPSYGDSTASSSSAKKDPPSFGNPFGDFDPFAAKTEESSPAPTPTAAPVPAPDNSAAEEKAAASKRKEQEKAAKEAEKKAEKEAAAAKKAAEEAEAAAKKAEKEARRQAELEKQKAAVERAKQEQVCCNRVNDLFLLLLHCFVYSLD
jgi:DNA polymerase III gamma/tau subunit